jgi:hypothetical protein
LYHGKKIMCDIYTMLSVNQMCNLQKLYCLKICCNHTQIILTVWICFFILMIPVQASIVQFLFTEVGIKRCTETDIVLTYFRKFFTHLIGNFLLTENLFLPTKFKEMFGRKISSFFVLISVFQKFCIFAIYHQGTVKVIV